MRRAQGYGIETGPDGIVETDSFTCEHCNRVVFVPAGKERNDNDGFCLMCMLPICAACFKQYHATLKCDPFEKKLDRIEARDRLLRSVG